MAWSAEPSATPALAPRPCARSACGLTAAASTKTVIVVDDDPFMLALVRRTLEAALYHVVTASTADGALTAYEAEHPSLVVTDIIMPDKDGLELIQEVHRRNPHLPIIAMSGGGANGYGFALRAAEVLGAHATIEKPFAPRALVEIVEQVLTAGGPRRG